MSAGRCIRCGRDVERLEGDHPDGTTRPPGWRRRIGVWVYADATANLCPACHVGKGVVDRAAGIEGAETASVWLLLRRRSAWVGWLAVLGRPVTFEAQHLSDLARTLQDTARTVGLCAALLARAAEELHRDGLHERAQMVAGVAFLLGRPPRRPRRCP